MHVQQETHVTSDVHTDYGADGVASVTVAGHRAKKAGAQ